MTKKDLFGVIDIGTLKIKLLVAEVGSGGQIQTQYQLRFNYQFS